MDKKFLTAFILPKEWEVIGYKLKPYSIRKHINLVAVESPFVKDAIPTPLDTLKFLKWCACDCESIINIPKTNLYDLLAYWRLSSDPRFHLYTIKKILNYIREYSSGPAYRVVTRGGHKQDVIVDKTTMPELLMLVAICMAKLNMKEDEVLDSPFAKLAWYGAAVASIEGADIRLLSDDEVKLAYEADKLKEFERQQAERLRLAMVNGKIPTRRIKIRNT